jgi:hypothetical protein
MDRGLDSACETVGPGRSEVDNDLGVRRKRVGHFDIEHDFAVGL